MKRLAWMTDIHLNFIPPAAGDEFLRAIDAEAYDGVLLGGDISESPELLPYLEKIAQHIQAPVYFVLGNHDYYFSSIARVHADVAEFCRRHVNMTWLTEGHIVELTERVGLVGHDGWADARLGDYERSLVMMNDYRLIEELARVDKRARWPLLKAFGDRAAADVRRVLPVALDRYAEVVFLTHVPPFREACCYQGQISNDEWLPHFTCHALGMAILEIMRERRDRKLLILCGHTHSSGETWPLPNIQVLTGGAMYGAPCAQRVFEFA